MLWLNSSGNFIRNIVYRSINKSLDFVFFYTSNNTLGSKGIDDSVCRNVGSACGGCRYGNGSLHFVFCKVNSHDRIPGRNVIVVPNFHIFVVGTFLSNFLEEFFVESCIVRSSGLIYKVIRINWISISHWKSYLYENI